MFEEKLEELQLGSVALLGLPTDANSSFLRGPMMAPGRIREALHCGSANLCAEDGTDLGSDSRFCDAGDLALESANAPFDLISRSIEALLVRNVRPLSLGGDHAVTFPLVRGFANSYADLTILHLDAHSDLYADFEGNPSSHASPFARMMEAGLAKRLVQVGIRTLNPHQREQAERFGVEVVECRGWGGESAQQIAREVVGRLDGPLYLSLDMDVLDPAFAPGVSHHEPGGLSTRDVLTLIQGIQTQLVGADIVELNPTRDPLGITAMAAAKFVKEIAAKMLETL